MDRVSAPLHRHLQWVATTGRSGLRRQRQPLRGQRDDWHGERVRTGKHDAHCHPHRTRLANEPGLRLQRQSLRGQLRQQHGERVRTGEYGPDCHAHRAEPPRGTGLRPLQRRSYVADFGNGTVSKFATGGTATTLTATFTGLNAPDALALDGNGNLYVANDPNPTVVGDSELPRHSEHSSPSGAPALPLPPQ